MQAMTRLQEVGHDISKMDKTHLRDLFPNVDMAIFEHSHSLYKWGGSMRIDPREFLLTVTMLACPMDDIEMESALMFTIFDPDGSETLDRDEFASLISASVMSKLTHAEFVMKNTAAREVFEEHARHEFTEENGAFYQLINEWKLSEELRKIDNTMDIVNKYIESGSENELNISSNQKKVRLRRRGRNVKVI